MKRILLTISFILLTALNAFSQYKYHSKEYYENLVNTLKEDEKNDKKYGKQDDPIGEIFKKEGDQFTTETEIFQKKNDFYLHVLLSFFDDGLSLVGLPKNVLRDFFDYCTRKVEFEDDGSIGLYKTPLPSAGKSFIRRFRPVKSAFNFDPDYRREIEIEENGNIYTYPVAYRSDLYDEEKECPIAFYSTIKSGQGYSILFDENFTSTQINMNRIMIDNKTEGLRSCFNHIDYTNAQIFKPLSYKNRQGNLLLSYAVYYSGSPKIVYTKPQYTVIGGQLMELDNGVHYIPSKQSKGYLSLIEKSTMRTKKNIVLEGIASPYFYYSTKNAYVFNRSRYFGTNRAEKGHPCLSNGGSPIYFIDENLNVDSVISPKEGDIYLDIQETPDYYLLCGSTTKQGYVDYDNPLLIVIDKMTHKVVARHVLKENKGSYYHALYVLNDNTILLLKRGMNLDRFFSIDHGLSFEVLELSSIISKENWRPSIVKNVAPSYNLQNNEELKKYGLDVYSLSDPKKVGLTHTDDPDNFITKAIFDKIDSDPKMLEYGIIVAHKDRKVGLFNTAGIEILPCEYGYNPESFYNDGVFILAKGYNQEGAVDNQGKVVIPFNYTKIGSFVEYVNNDKISIVESNNLKGVISRSGKVIIPLGHYDFIDYYKDDLFFLMKNYKTGIYCASTQSYVLEPFYQWFVPLSMIENDLLHVIENDGKHGVITDRGEIVINSDYDYLDPIDENYLLAKKDSHYGVIDITGKTILPFEFEINEDDRYLFVIFKGDRVAFIGSADDSSDYSYLEEFDLERCKLNVKYPFGDDSRFVLIRRYDLGG